MKTTERHHLKENELSVLARSARRAAEERRGPLLSIVVALAVLAIVALGYFGWRGRVEGRAGALLAEASIVETARVGPPAAPGAPSAGLTFPTEKEKLQAAMAKFTSVADQYPSTDAGLFARYREATILMALENPADALKSYQLVIDRAGSRIYGEMARLGLAEAQARGGQFDSAINAYKELVTQRDGSLPIDGILMQLGRTYLDAGKPADAQQVFTRVVEEFPNSPFSGDARRELDNLKKT
jgi:tetratricopeptide (TPR) repeat protein